MESAAALCVPEITYGDPEGRKVSRLTVASNSKHINVIISANVQSAVHFWKTLHLELIRYLKQEDGEGLLREATPEQQNLWKAFVKLQRRRDKEGIRWINWEQHKAIRAAITQDIAASSCPNVSL